MEEKIVYFEEPGTGNTDKTLNVAIERAKDRGINKIVLASTTGETARLAAKRLAGSAKDTWISSSSAVRAMRNRQAIWRMLPTEDKVCS